MLNIMFKYYLITFSLLLNISFVAQAVAAEKITFEHVPKDVLYMLEDMYGADKTKWPSLIQMKDLNQDKHNDWIVQNQSCLAAKDCAAELFICIPDEKGKCVEYCYKEVKSLNNIKDKIKSIKCESTC